METLVGAFVSSTALLITLAAAGLITYGALRGFRNHYVAAPTLSLEKFAMSPSPIAGQAAIEVVGRQRGILGRLLTVLGLESRVTLTVTPSDFTLRAASLGGMLVNHVPLKAVRKTICGYQRSLLALFLTVFFALTSVWVVLLSLPQLLGLLSARTEAVRENAAEKLSSLLWALLIAGILCALALAWYHFSKRAAFGVDSGRSPVGIVFKRSLIGDAVFDLTTAEQATVLLGRLVDATIYEKDFADTAPIFTPTPPPAGGSKMGPLTVAGVLAGVLVLAVYLGWYGHGVNLYVMTTPPGTFVYVDNEFAGTTQGAGALRIEHVTREYHVLHFQNYGFQAMEKPIALSAFSGEQPVQAQLKPLQYPVTLETSPAQSSVTLDGHEVGATDGEGRLVLAQVERGSHTLAVAHEGFKPNTWNVEVTGKRMFHFGLISDAEAARQQGMEQERQEREALDRARSLYQGGHYQEALEACDNVLKLNPANSAAASLKKQIEATRKILGQ